MKKHLALIHLSRALVPLLVTLFHLALILHQYFGYEGLPLYKLDRSGGVDFFFVLSGFMCVFVYGRKLGQPDERSRFLLGRFMRIYPLYWLLTLLILPVYFVHPEYGLGHERDWSAIVSSMLLLPDTRVPHVMVAWSLRHTLIGYLGITAAFYLPRPARVPALVAWGTLSLLAALGWLPVAGIGWFLLNFANVQILLGGAAAWLVLHRPISDKLGGVALLTGLLGFPLAWVLDFQGLPFLVYLAIVTLNSLLVLVGTAALDFRHEYRLPAWVTLQGNASYALFLSNFICLSLLAKLGVWWQLPSVVPIPLLAIVMATITIAVGCALHIWVEKPMLAWLKPRLLPARSGASPKNPKPVENVANSVVPSATPGLSAGFSRVERDRE